MSAGVEEEITKHRCQQHPPLEVSERSEKPLVVHFQFGDYNDISDIQWWRDGVAPALRKGLWYFNCSQTRVCFVTMGYEVFITFQLCGVVFLKCMVK